MRKFGKWLTLSTLTLCILWSGAWFGAKAILAHQLDNRTAQINVADYTITGFPFGFDVDLDTPVLNISTTQGPVTIASDHISISAHILNGRTAHIETGAEMRVQSERGTYTIDMSATNITAAPGLSEIDVRIAAVDIAVHSQNEPWQSGYFDNLNALITSHYDGWLIIAAAVSEFGGYFDHSDLTAQDVQLDYNGPSDLNALQGEQPDLAALQISLHDANLSYMPSETILHEVFFEDAILDLTSDQGTLRGHLIAQSGSIPFWDVPILAAGSTLPVLVDSARLQFQQPFSTLGSVEMLAVDMDTSGVELPQTAWDRFDPDEVFTRTAAGLSATFAFSQGDTRPILQVDDVSLSLFGVYLGLRGEAEWVFDPIVGPTLYTTDITAEFSGLDMLFPDLAQAGLIPSSLADTLHRLIYDIYSQPNAAGTARQSHIVFDGTAVEINGIPVR